MKHTLLIVCIVIFAVFGSAQQPGTLDTSFGNGGTLIRTDQQGEYSNVTIQPDGKIITTIIDDTVAYLTRYNRNATNAPGRTLSLSVKIQGSNRLKAGRFSSIIAQPDGKLLAAGTIYDLETDIFIARFKNDATPDSSFGTNGIVSFGAGDFSTIRGLIIQPDKRILLSVMIVYDAVPEIDDPTLYRFNANGKPDSSFGNNGVVSKVMAHWTIGLQSDGKIILAGSNTSGLLFSRRLTNGAIDPSFGKGGIATVSSRFYPSVINNFFLSLMAIQADDKIIGAGRADRT